MSLEGCWIILGYLCAYGGGGVFVVSYRAAADKDGVAGAESSSSHGLCILDGRLYLFSSHHCLFVHDIRSFRVSPLSTKRVNRPTSC